MKRLRTLIGVASVLCIVAIIVAPASASLQNMGEAPGGRMDGGMGMLAHLDRLEEQGYDVSAIRAAVESGDAETSRALMQQFMEEHKDELPARPMTGGFAKQAGGHRNAAD
jgi:Spy/CpxP family protein refolding chaperone